MRLCLELVVVLYPLSLYLLGFAMANSVTTGDDVTALTNEDAIMTCMYTSQHEPTLRWYKRSTHYADIIVERRENSEPEFAEGYDRHGLVDQASLLITNTEVNDSGLYYCEISGPGVPRSSDSIKLDVSDPYAPINAVISVDELPVIEGNDVLLNCTANGLPTPTYDWTQNGVELSDRNKYKINEDGSELTILSTTRHERDYYNCTATNEMGSDATAVFIDVYYEPHAEWPLCEVHVETNENYMAEGDFAELTCKATGGNPQPHLEWYNNSEALPYCTSTTDDNGVVTETVSCWTLKPYDNGVQYECKGKHDATKDIQSCFTEVFDVKYSPTWQTCDRTVGEQFEEDDDFTLTCKSDGNPLATLQWVNGTSSNILQETTLYDNEIAINEYSWHLTRGDNQVFFKCYASNDISGNTQDCESPPIRVNFAPLSVWLTGYTDTARKGDRLQLLCVTDSSNPVSTISWYKNDQLITDDDHEEIQEEDVRDGSFHGNVTEGGLHFDVLASHNEIEFFCKTTRLGYSDEDFTVSVPTYVYFPPSEPDGCATSLTGYSAPVVEGDDLVLTCTSCSGNPTPIIEWFEDEHKIEIGLGDISYSPGDYHGKIAVQDLTLHLTYQHHGQRLRCESFNEEFTMENDRAVSSKIILDVQYAPFVENEEENQQQSVNLTDDAELLCEINSNPEVEITWFDFDNETISNLTGKFLVRKNTTSAITTGVLTIFNVSESDLGYYRCHASNDINGVNFIINLWGKRSPFPADSVIVTDKTEHSLTLEWVPGFDGGLPQQFQLEYRDSDTMKGDLKRTHPTTNTSYTIYELQAMTEYHITVVSFNSIGESHSDPPTVNSTLPKTPVMDEDIKFNQYTGELLIEAPTGSCIKIDEYTSDGNWTTHKFDPINGPCDTSVTLKIDGSVLLRIYFCNDDYTECGEPLEYEFHTESNSNTGAIIGIAVTIAVLLVLLYSGIFLYIRNKKSKGKEESRGQIYANRTDSDRHDYMDLELPKDKFDNDVDNEGVYADIHQTETEYMGLVFRNRNPEVCDEDNTMVYKPSADDGQIPHLSNNLKLGETIIDGIFTKLVTAELPLSSQRAMAVTVKILKKLDDMEGKRALGKEVEFMRTLPRNPNILSCLHEFTTFDPLRLVLEPCYHGNLKTYLQNLNKEETEMKALLLFSLDCANGMKFLEEIQCVHRHLAARVVMLDGQRTCKISELGYSTAVMDQVTYEKIVKRRLPIRWMALESIENCVYSSETDVWSYGVLLWEIFSFGVTPYRSMNITDVLSKLRAGHRLPIPEKCSNDVYSIMEMCWQRDPSNRPTFDDMVQYFETLLSDSTLV